MTSGRTGSIATQAALGAALLLASISACGDDDVFDLRKDLADTEQHYLVDGVEVTTTFDDVEKLLVVRVPVPPDRITLVGPATSQFAFRLVEAERAPDPESDDDTMVQVPTEPDSRGSFNSVGSRLRLDVEVRFPDGEALSIHGLGDRITVP